MMAAMLWLISTTIGRYLLGAGTIGLAALAGWVWLKANYVPRYEFNAMREQLRVEREASAERDASAEQDAAQAQRDAVKIRELEDKVDEFQAEGDDPTVWDRDDTERLQSLQRD